MWKEPDDSASLRYRHQITIDLEVEDDHEAVLTMIEDLLAPLGIGFVTMRGIPDEYRCAVCHATREEFPGECMREHCTSPWKSKDDDDPG